jgi:hypothetical protein
MMVVADNVTDLIYHGWCCPHIFHDLPCNGRSFFFLKARSRAAMFSFSFMDAYVVKVCSGKDNGQVSAFFGCYGFCMPGHPCGMTDALEILAEIFFHFHCNTVFHKFLTLGQKFRWKLTKALVCKFAVGCTSEVHAGIYKPVAAVLAFAHGIVFEKFNGFSAFRALGFKYCPWFPVSAVLSRTFHCFTSTL